MAELQPYVTRPLRRASWNLVRGRDTVATASGMLRPDRRWFVSVDAWDDGAYATLVPAMTDDLRHDLYTTVVEGDSAEIERWQRLGFELVRREIEFDLPVDPAATGLGPARPPVGVTLVSADVVDADKLRELDDALRADVPGTDGWRNDPAEFVDYTFDPRHFDPETYLVAIDEARRAFAGLVRVWMDRDRPRLGLIAVTRDYRRLGLARALLATAFRPLHERGIAVIAAEADADSTASTALLAAVGARRTGGTVELRRRFVSGNPTGCG